jgi:ADP-ribose pyrophosphatase
MADWQTLSSRIAYQNKWLSIQEDSVINPAGEKTIYGLVKIASDSVYIVPVQDEGMWLTNQYRYPLKRTSWEFPAGQTDGQDILEAGRRELLEESGLEAGSLKVMTTFYGDTGTSPSRITTLLATDIIKKTDELDEADGILEAKLFSLAEIRQMILSGEIVCPHTITSYYVVTEYLKDRDNA